MCSSWQIRLRVACPGEGAGGEGGSSMAWHLGLAARFLLSFICVMENIAPTWGQAIGDFQRSQDHETRIKTRNNRSLQPLKQELEDATKLFNQERLRFEDLRASASQPPGQLTLSDSEQGMSILTASENRGVVPGVGMTSPTPIHDSGGVPLAPQAIDSNVDAMAGGIFMEPWVAQAMVNGSMAIPFFVPPIVPAYTPIAPSFSQAVDGGKDRILQQLYPEPIPSTQRPMAFLTSDRSTSFPMLKSTPCPLSATTPSPAPTPCVITDVTPATLDRREHATLPSPASRKEASRSMPTPTRARSPGVESKGIVNAGISKGALMARHNMYRCMHGVPELRWSPTIENMARAWAQHARNLPGGLLLPRRTDGFGLFGEHTAYGDFADVSRAVDNWYAEFSQSNSSVFSYTPSAARSAHLVRRETTSVGCVAEDHLLVCLYYPRNDNTSFRRDVPPVVKKSAECDAKARCPRRTCLAPTVNLSGCVHEWRLDLRGCPSCTSKWIGDCEHGFEDKAVQIQTDSDRPLESPKSGGEMHVGEKTNVSNLAMLGIEVRTPGSRPCSRPDEANIRQYCFWSSRAKISSSSCNSSSGHGGVGGTRGGSSSGWTAIAFNHQTCSVGMSVGADAIREARGQCGQGCNILDVDGKKCEGEWGRGGGG
eukprot:TRINITY_DN3892_c0_g1_i1.p1 TRINITY_DN3892_c0_g1~~TRINITY_DN3892_c0_g1_i1.p1  ORF type:complete len:653 (+),score=70.33 TRINITY_DN3892_c0_g1_i1:150-2108(+)